MRKVLQMLSTSKITSVTKYSLEKELFKQFAKLKPGVVLDVGSKMAPYKGHIPHTKYYDFRC